MKTPVRERWILDLCGGTGAWSKPYRQAGYRVTIIDPMVSHPDNPLRREERGSWDYAGTLQDWLAEMRADAKANRDNGLRGAVHGVLFAMDCTEFAGCGSRWWKDKPASALADAMNTLRTGLEIIAWAQPKWWVMENPRGRLGRLMGEDAWCVESELWPYLKRWKMHFDPCDYGDPYTKDTYLWGNFTEPVKTPVPPTLNKVGSKGEASSPIHRAAPGPLRKMLRSKTPPGFAQAFKRANP